MKIGAHFFKFCVAQGDPHLFDWFKSSIVKVIGLNHRLIIDFLKKI